MFLMPVIQFHSESDILSSITALKSSQTQLGTRKVMKSECWLCDIDITHREPMVNENYGSIAVFPNTMLSNVVIDWSTSD
uniref:Uncharacterized protein n=1 Tax=Arion vulgaris TaxID=1028688 RepID=A0A0B7BWE9_9EUPU